MSDSHGSSPALWAAVVVALVGFTVGGIGMVVGPSWLLFWIGTGLVVLAPVVGAVLAAAGMGAVTPQPTAEQRATDPTSTQR